MGLRPAKCYRNIGHKQRAYTRIAIKVPRRNYIGAAPALKIRQFNMGNPAAKYNRVGDLFVKDDFDLRDNAIESARIAINRKLVKTLGKDGFFMKVRVYPSHIVRENKQAQGAGADRVSQGMSMSFGVPIGRAARVRKGQVVYSILFKKGQEDFVKDALLRARARFSSEVGVKFHDDVESVGTIPTKKIRDVEIPTAEETKAAAEGKESETAKEEKTEETEDEAVEDSEEKAVEEKKK